MFALEFINLFYKFMKLGGNVIVYEICTQHADVNGANFHPAVLANKRSLEIFNQNMISNEENVKFTSYSIL